MEDNNTIDDYLTEEEIAKRPKFLKVLCILSFIGTGISVIAYVISAIYFLKFSSGVLTNNEISTEIQSRFFTGYFIAGVFTTILSFVGVIKIWRLQKIGYYIYISSTAISIIIRIVQSIGSSLSAAGITGIVFTVIFAILYSVNFKHLK